MRLILMISSVISLSLTTSALGQAQYTIDYEYDALGRLKSVDNKVGQSSYLTKSYELDNAGNRTSVSSEETNPIIISGNVRLKSGTVKPGPIYTIYPPPDRYETSASQSDYEFTWYAAQNLRDIENGQSTAESCSGQIVLESGTIIQISGVSGRQSFQSGPSFSVYLSCSVFEYTRNYYYSSCSQSQEC